MMKTVNWLIKRHMQIGRETKHVAYLVLCSFGKSDTERYWERDSGFHRFQKGDQRFVYLCRQRNVRQELKYHDVPDKVDRIQEIKWLTYYHTFIHVNKYHAETELVIADKSLKGCKQHPDFVEIQVMSQFGYDMLILCCDFCLTAPRLLELPASESVTAREFPTWEYYFRPADSVRKPILSTHKLQWECKRSWMIIMAKEAWQQWYEFALDIYPLLILQYCRVTYSLRAKGAPS